MVRIRQEFEYPSEYYKELVELKPLQKKVVVCMGYSTYNENEKKWIEEIKEGIYKLPRPGPNAGYYEWQELEEKLKSKNMEISISNIMEIVDIDKILSHVSGIKELSKKEKIARLYQGTPEIVSTTFFSPADPYDGYGKKKFFETLEIIIAMIPEKLFLLEHPTNFSLPASTMIGYLTKDGKEIPEPSPLCAAIRTLWDLGIRPIRQKVTQQLFQDEFILHKDKLVIPYASLVAQNEKKGKFYFFDDVKKMLKEEEFDAYSLLILKKFFSEYGDKEKLQLLQQGLIKAG